MNIVIVYFSQSGNTRKVAQTIADAFRKAGHTTRTIPMKGDLSKEISDCEVLGVGVPCFESQAPTPVKDFLQTLPPLNGKPTFVFATSSGAPGRVLYDLTSRLRKKGAEVMGGFIARGTVYFPAPSLVGRMPARPNQDDLAQARTFAEAVDRYLRSGHSGPMPGGRKDALTLTWAFYQLVGLIAKPPLLRILMPKPKLNRDLCDQCKLCCRQCPMQSISMKPYPVLSGRCIRCYHCYNICPQKAFSMSWLLGDLAVGSLYNTLFFRLFGDLEPGERMY
jgi:flavodoxin/NAD-dependent dihydropyrimidine dehydrogenase PreA subunit